MDRVRLKSGAGIGVMENKSKVILATTIVTICVSIFISIVMMIQTKGKEDISIETYALDKVNGRYVIEIENSGFGRQLYYYTDEDGLQHRIVYLKVGVTPNCKVYSGDAYNNEVKVIKTTHTLNKLRMTTTVYNVYINRGIK